MEPQPCSLEVASDQVISAQCKGVVMARLESPLTVENGLIETSPEAHSPKGLCIARTFVQDFWEVPVRVLSATCHDQELIKGSPVVHCEPVTLVTPRNFEQPCAQDTTPVLQDVIAAARPEFEELTECRDIFAMKSEDYGWTERVCHRIDMGEA
jgi:hypothetical protein